MKAEKGKICVEMKVVKDPKGGSKIKATVPLDMIYSSNFDGELFEDEIAKLEKRYLYLVTCLENILYAIRSRKRRKNNVFLYWEMGDKIVSFLGSANGERIVIANFVKSLVRDLKISRKTIRKLEKFRLHYSDVTLLDPERSFNSYIRNLKKRFGAEDSKFGGKDEHKKDRSG